MAFACHAPARRFFGNSNWNGNMNEHNNGFLEGMRIVDPQSLLEDTHERLAELRRDCPVISFGPGRYLVLRADDVLELATHPETRQVEGHEIVALNKIPEGMVQRFHADVFLFSNGEDHRKRRGLFARSFAHRTMQDMRGVVREAAERIVATLPRGESFDFVEQMAARVPAEMIAAILGLPQTDASSFAARVYDISKGIVPVYPHEKHDRIETAMTELYAYVEDHLKDRLAAPKGDLLSSVAASWQEEQAISFESLVFQVITMIVGGSDTTRAAFAMLVALLLQDGDAWQELLTDRSLVAGAVSEALRFEPSVGTIPRVLLTDMSVGDIRMPAGSVLRLSTLSALRDPALYANPERFDIRRTDHPRLHLVFGLGPHRCIGEVLARIEMEEALDALLDAAPDIELETVPRMQGFGGIRPITAMRTRIG